MEDTQYQKLLESVSNAIQRLNKLNDQFQTDSENEDVKGSLSQDVIDEREEITRLIEQLKKDIQRLESNAGHLVSRSQKLKSIKQTYMREIERTKTICKMLESKVAIKRTSIYNEQKTQQSNEDLLKQDQIYADDYMKHDLKNQLLIQNNEEIQNIDKEARSLQQVVNELALQTDQQDGMLDIISTNQAGTKENLVNANVELAQAQDSQSSANKKYCILAIIVLIAVVVLVLILVRDKL